MAETTNQDIPRVRTYAADMARIIRERGETLASIANKERTATRAAQDSPQKTLSARAIATILGTAILVVGGSVVLGVTLFLNAPEETPFTPVGIIFANQSFRVIADTETNLTETLAVVRGGQNLSLGEVLRIDVFEQETFLEGPKLLDRLGFPEPFTREVGRTMIGIHAFDRNQPFIIAEIDAYDRAFRALLTWEPDMGEALGDFFAPVQRVGDAPSLVFEDRVMQNFDVRRVRDIQNWPILYTFPRSNLVIITTNEFTLREVLTRLGSARQ